MIYLDTSAAAKALIDEAVSVIVRRMFPEGTQFVSSKLLAVELHAVADRRFIASDAVQELLDRVALVSLDGLLDDAISMHSRLRTLDALHLAKPVRLKDVISSIITFDKEVAEAASRNGIPAAAMP